MKRPDRAEFRSAAKDLLMENPRVLSCQGVVPSREAETRLSRLGRAFLRRQNRRHGPDELFLVRGEESRGVVRWIIKKGKA